MRAALQIKRFVLLFLAGFLALTTSFAADNPRVLIYTRNQIGQGLYVHDNIAQATAAIQKAAAAQHIDTDVSDNPTVFTEANLKRYKALVFNNTNNEILDNEEQKAAFQDYIRHGGGFVGIHSASGSMRKWPWFWSLVGGKFMRHPKMQTFTVKVKDREDISTRHLPAEFEWTDEFYYVDNMPPGLHVLLAGDLLNWMIPKRKNTRAKPSGTSSRWPGVMNSRAAGPGTPRWATRGNITPTPADGAHPGRNSLGHGEKLAIVASQLLEL